MLNRSLNRSLFNYLSNSYSINTDIYCVLIILYFIGNSVPVASRALALSTLYYCVLSYAQFVEIDEYCLRTNSESFHAKCLKNEVIVMNRAVYGRMKIGKCLEDERDMIARLGSDPLFLGCSVDVLSLLDRRCSGKNHCELRGTDDELQDKGPCHASFKSYLEATYECATGKINLMKEL